MTANLTLKITAKGNTMILVDGKKGRIVKAEESIVDALTEFELFLTANLQTHTGTVHAPGRYVEDRRSNAPLCCVSASAISRLHFLVDVPADTAVTCKHCVAAADRRNAGRK